MARAPRSALGGLVQVEHREEGFLRHLDAADRLHPLLAGLLLLEQLALAGDVAAVALREHVLALRLDGLARDHARPDRRLDRNVEELAWDLLAQAVDKRTPARVCGIAMDHEREGVHRLGRDEDVDPDELALSEAREVLVEA